MADEAKKAAQDKDKPREFETETSRRQEEGLKAASPGRGDDKGAPPPGTLHRVEGTSQDRQLEMEAKRLEAFNKAMASEYQPEEGGGEEGVLYEVMVDTWGYDPVLERGTFVRKGDVPYDLEWAERVGTVRRAPEYEGSVVPHATKPLEMGSPARVDEDQQRSARDAAGFERK